MTAFTTMADADLEAGDPLTQAKVRALRNNPVAITEGASGAPGILGALLDSGTASSVATLDIDMTGFTHVLSKILVIHHILPATDGATLRMRVSTNGGSSFDAGASDYYTFAAASAAYMDVIAAMGNAANEGGAGWVFLPHTTRTDLWPTIKVHTHYLDTGGLPGSDDRSCARRAAQDTDAIRLLCSSGNIASIYWSLHSAAYE